jgi:hypothetical protein
VPQTRLPLVVLQANIPHYTCHQNHAGERAIFRPVIRQIYIQKIIFKTISLKGKFTRMQMAMPGKKLCEHFAYNIPKATRSRRRLALKIGFANKLLKGTNSL